MGPRQALNPVGRVGYINTGVERGADGWRLFENLIMPKIKIGGVHSEKCIGFEKFDDIIVRPGP